MIALDCRLTREEKLYMNAFIAVMLVFAAIGFLDKTFGLRWGLAESFDRGLVTMGTMAVPMIGVSCAGVEFIQRNIDTISEACGWLPFDPSLIIGAAFATDMGGFFIAEQIAGNEQALILNGIILSALLGQMTSFQLPLFLADGSRDSRRDILKGFITGVVIIPAGLITAGLMLRMDAGLLAAQILPVLILCALIALGLLKFPSLMVRIFEVFARVMQIVIGIAFFVTVLGIFVPAAAYSDMEAVHEAVTILFRSAVIISGSLVLSQIILKFFRNRLRRFGRRLGINEVSVISMIMNFATSLAILPLISKMDKKGRMLNAAFSVSGAYMLGGQLGFVSSVSDPYIVTVYIVSKLVCGILSLAIMYKLYDRLEGKDGEID